MANEVDFIIIGAGVVGLAIAAEVSRTCKNVFVFEIVSPGMPRVTTVEPMNQSSYEKKG